MSDDFPRAALKRKIEMPDDEQEVAKRFKGDFFLNHSGDCRISASSAEEEGQVFGL